MRIRLAQIVMVSVCLMCVGMIVGPARADFKNFGIYQDTNGDGILNPGDTFINGFMSWYTFDSAATSYNYGDHGDAAITGSSDLTGAPWASADANHNPLNWLRMDDDELHMYMSWSHYDNTSQEGIENQRGGFALGMIANDYIRGRTDLSPSGGYDLDIAIRNDGTALPQVTLSDDYTVTGGATTGRPPFPGTKDNASQELYKITDPDGTDPYNHHFEGRWNYTASTADGGIIGGIHNSDYDIDISPSDIVTSILGDGLVIRIDPSRFTEVSKIIVYDFGFGNGAVDTLGNVAPAGYLGAGADFAGLGIEIPIGTDADKTFFIASIPEVIPEPVTLLSLTIMALASALVTRRRHSRV
ncbi:MAG: hypothetical protein GWP14_06875 [Actinobacteria bacterium]|nr:hypothetical protein [Actinomycetota bacterium]